MTTLSPPNNYRPHKHRLFTFTMVLLWLVAISLVTVNRQNIIDWWRLRNYQAPATVSAIADQDSMTAYGRKVFYVNHPDLVSKSNFSKSCPNDGGEQTIVLGCYHGGQGGIFLLDVTDSRLDGVEQVTAAHEMLHAAYDRLSRSERSKVDAMLMDYYKNDLQDKRIAETIDAYKKSEPKDVVNEMHSIFATEIANLPAPLEQYYQRYFTNRGQVVANAERYKAEFTSRQGSIVSYDAQLDTMNKQIEISKASVKSMQASIDSQKATLAQLKAAGNISAYNAGVPTYNSLIDNYNTEVAHLQSLVSQYNQIVTARNDVALEEDQLVEDLNSNVKTIQK